MIIYVKWKVIHSACIEIEEGMRPLEHIFEEAKDIAVNLEEDLTYLRSDIIKCEEVTELERGAQDIFDCDGNMVV